MEIKLSIPGLPHADLSQFTGNGDGNFGDDVFFVNNQRRQADAWFIFEDVWEGDSEGHVPAHQVHFLAAEASYHLEKFLNPSHQDFFRQFSTVHSCHPIDVPNFEHAPPFLPWMVNANHGTVLSPHHRDINFLRSPGAIEKPRKMSMICSSQAGTPEHRLRIAFAKAVSREFGDAIDWFGNGVEPVAEKWDALAPYSRTIVLENRCAPGLFTEKIVDAYLAETVPLYWGDPHIEKYLPVRESHRLNLYDFSGSLRTISRWLSEPVSVDEKVDLAKGKASALNELHFLNRISAIADHDRADLFPTREVNLRPARSFTDTANQSRLYAFRKDLDSLSRLARRLFRGST